MSFWESFGEAVGYGLAAIVLGPPAAIMRSERRRLRRAFLAWCDAHEPQALEGSRGVTRRAITFRTSLGPITARAEVDVFARRARIEAAIPLLSTLVRAAVVREGGALRGESSTLDAASIEALRERVAASKLGELRALGLAVATGELVVVVGPRITVEAWDPIGEGIVELAEWLANRWPVSYRS
jgi:hypothetical protein